MLTRVDVQSENPFFLEIRDARPSDSIIVQKIEGLGPPDVDLFMGDYARDGGSYGGRRVPPRTVVFTLGINPNWKMNESVSGLRTMLYKAFLDPFGAADGLSFILHDDELPDRYTQGHTEKFEGDIFSDDTTVQITVRCPNPYILDVDLTTEVASGPSFPFEYSGSAETGLLITAEFTAAASLTTLDLNGQKMFLDYDFFDNDLLLVDTRRGSRKIQVTRTVESVTTTTDILYAMTSDSTWLELHSFDNLFKIYGATPAAVVANLDEISYRGQHWGV